MLSVLGALRHLKILRIGVESLEEYHTWMIWGIVWPRWYMRGHTEPPPWVSSLPEPQLSNRQLSLLSSSASEKAPAPGSFNLFWWQAQPLTL